MNVSAPGSHESLLNNITAVKSHAHSAGVSRWRVADCTLYVLYCLLIVGTLGITTACAERRAEGLSEC